MQEYRLSEIDGLELDFWIPDLKIAFEYQVTKVKLLIITNIG